MPPGVMLKELGVPFAEGGRFVEGRRVFPCFAGIREVDGSALAVAGLLAEAQANNMLLDTQIKFSCPTTEHMA